MTMDEPGFVLSTFSKNRARLLDHQVAGCFFAEVVRQAQAEQLSSEEHFAVDGTLIGSPASLKCVRRKHDDDDGPIDPDDRGVDFCPLTDFHGERRSDKAHTSVTDPKAKLFRKSRAAATKLYFSGNAVAENRCGLNVDFSLDDVLTGERGVRRQIAFIDDGRRISGLDRRTMRHATYRLSQPKRKLIEQAFGWPKTAAGPRKSRFFGRAKTELYALIAMRAYNPARMARLRPMPI